MELLCFLYTARSKYELSKLLEISWRETTERKSSTSLLYLTVCIPCTRCPSAKLRQCRGPGGLQKTAPLAEGMWVLFISGQGCAGLSECQAGLLDLNLTFWLWCRISAGLGYPGTRFKVSLGSSAAIRRAEGNCREPFPKPLEDRGRARAAFWQHHQHHMHSAGRAEELSPPCCAQPHQHACLPVQAVLRSKFQLFMHLRYADA